MHSAPRPRRQTAASCFVIPGPATEMPKSATADLGGRSPESITPAFPFVATGAWIPDSRFAASGMTESKFVNG